MEHYVQNCETGQQSMQQRDKNKNRIRRTRTTIGIVISGDILSVTAGLLIADVISRRISDSRLDLFRGEWNSELRLGFIGILLATWITTIALFQGYSFEARIKPAAGMIIAFRASFYFLAIVAVAEILFRLPIVHYYLLFGLPLTLIFLSISRFLSAELVRSVRRRNKSSLLIVGNTRDINEIIGNQPDERFPYHDIAVLLVTDPENVSALPELEDCQIGEFLPGQDITTQALQYGCESFWVASVAEFGHKNLRRLAWNLQKLKVRLYIEPMIEGVSGTRLSPVRIGPRQTIFVEKPRVNAANGILKRVFDIIFSSVVLVLIFPILIITAIAIKLDDGGPVFYFSERIGHKGKPFRVWKFRSMATDAEERLKKLIEKEGGPRILFKMKDDPRITNVGKFIRKYSIDELPQFINALNGTMSVVGPRPPLAREVALYDSDMRTRLEVRPGITGLWQVSGRSNLPPELAQQLDLYYVDNWSISLDASIIAQTVKVVITAEGAY